MMKPGSPMNSPKVRSSCLVGVQSGPFYPCPFTYLRYILDARKGLSVKRAALYMRVSTLDQHPETQLYDLRQMAEQRGYEIVEEYPDMISSTKARRPGLDTMMRDARR